MQTGLVLRFMFTVWLCRGTMWAAVTLGSSAHHQQLDVCATQLNGSNLHGVISLWPLARKDGLPRFTTQFNDSNHAWNYSFNPCEDFDVLLDSPNQGAQNQCHHVAVCKYNQVESYNLGTHDTANFKVQTDSSDNVKVQLIYSNNKSVQARDFIIDLICDEKRSEPDSGLFRVIGDSGKGALVSELHHQCCCVGGCPYDGPGKDKRSGETLLFVVGAAVAVSMMAVLLGGLCFIWRRHQQADSGLSGVKRKGADVGPELGTKTDLRDYEPAAVVQKKCLPVLKDITIHWGTLEMCQRLGGGIFGDTHLAKWHAMTVAVKRLTLLVHENQITPDALKLMKEEVWFLSRQRHKNIVTILGLCLDGKLPSIITEYVIGECLKDFIKVQGRLLSWPHRVRICLQVADGMAFLHSTKPPIIHRDLRCGNLFLSDDDVVKVADFGLIKLLQPVREECPQDDCCCRRTMSACPASIRWTAPELLTQPVTKEPASPDTADQGRLDREEQGGSQRRAMTPACDVITPACDMYSFAMVMWELPMCVDPFDGIALESEVMDVVKNGGRPETPASADMMPQYKELMKGCWHQIPARRPTFKQIGRQLRDLGAQARAYQKQLQNQQRMRKLQKDSPLLM